MKQIYLGVVILFLFCLVFASRPVHATWWDLNYDNEFPISITNQNSTTEMPAYYTVFVTFNHSANVSVGFCSQVDGDDFRVVYQDTTELDRELVSGYAWNAENTTIAFKTKALIPAGQVDNANYSIYCGNAGASSPKNNLQGIYLQADTFDDGSLGSQWTQEGGAMTLTEQSGYLTLGNGTFGSRIVNNTLKDIAYNVTVSMLWQGVADNDEAGGILVRGQEDESAGSYSLHATCWDGFQCKTQLKFRGYRIGTSLLLNQTAHNYAKNAWQYETIIFHGSNLFVYVNGSFAYSAMDTTYKNGTLGLMSWGTPTGNAYVDNFTARLYMLPEPSSSVGDMSTMAVSPDSSLNVSITNPTNTTYADNNTLYTEILVHNVNSSNINCWYKLNGGSNTSFSNCNNVSIPVSVGINNLVVYINGTNTTNEWIYNDTFVNFTVTNNYPSVTIDYPINTSYVEVSRLNFTVVDLNTDKCWYKLDTSANTSLPSCNNVTILTSVGFHTLRVSANDTFNYVTVSEVNFSINGSVLEVHYLSEEDGTYLPNPLNISLFNSSLFTASYSNQTNISQLNFVNLNGSSYLLPTGNSTFTAWYGSGIRKYSLFIKANQSQEPNNLIQYVYFPDSSQSCNYIFNIQEIGTGTNLEDVLIKVKRNVNGSLVTVHESKTQADGKLQLYMKYNTPYQFLVSKENYTSLDFTYELIQGDCSGTKTITMSSTSSVFNITDYYTWLLNGVTVTYIPNRALYNGTVNVTIYDALGLMTYQWLNVTNTAFNGTKTTLFYSNNTNASRQEWLVNTSLGYNKYKTCLFRGGQLYCVERTFIYQSTSGAGNINFDALDKAGGLSVGFWRIIFLVLLSIVVAFAFRIGGYNAALLMIICGFTLAGIWVIFDALICIFVGILCFALMKMAW